MMPVSADAILEHLRVLVAADSSDPASQITPEHAAIEHCARTFEGAGFTVTIEDLCSGDQNRGCVNLLAIRGDADARTGTLFNCHLDTVKVNPDWTHDPFALTVENGNAVGLGACDIKGAAACLLAVAEATAGPGAPPMAVLLTTDEEAGRGVCVRSFLDTQGGRWSRVVVAEPTDGKAVTQHRGFASFEIRFSGTAGHTSGDGASSDSAVHKAARWMSAALALAGSRGVLAGARFNIGIVNGGTASNVVAAEAVVRFGFRPEPGPDAAGVTGARIAALKALLPADGSAEWVDRFLAPPLSDDGRAADAVLSWGVRAGAPVDFWTEAALFAEDAEGRPGLPAIVLGPGDIAQAHAADESVEVASLEVCAAAYQKIVRAEGLGEAARRDPARMSVEGGSHAS